MINQFWWLQKVKVKRFLSIFKHREWAKILVIGVFGLVVAGLAGGVFLFSLNGFRFIAAYPTLAEPLVVYVLAATLFLSFILVAVSAVITATGTVFGREDNQLLLSLPLRHQEILESRVVEAVVVSAWPVVVFALPLVSAYGTVFRLDTLTLLVLFGGLVSLTLLASLAGVVAALMLGRWLGRKKEWVIWGAVLAGGPWLARWLSRVLLPAGLRELERLPLARMVRFLEQQTLLAKGWPSSWVVKWVGWQKHPRQALAGLGRLLALELGLLVVLRLMAGRFYFLAIDKNEEGRFLAGRWDRVRKRLRRFPYLLKGRWGALTEKDWLMMVRSPAELFQGGFIVFLALLYLAVLSKVPLVKMAAVLPGWFQERLIKINFMVGAYILALWVIRFVFPQVSLEGQSGWLIWSAPIKRESLFWQKLVSSFAVVVALGEGLNWLSWRALRLPASFLGSLAGLMVVVALTLTTIGLVGGTLWPNFEEKNPEKLSTSPGGVMTTAGCLAYIGGVAAVLLAGGGRLLFSWQVQLVVWLVSLAIDSWLWSLALRRIKEL